MNTQLNKHQEDALVAFGIDPKNIQDITQLYSRINDVFLIKMQDSAYVLKCFRKLTLQQIQTLHRILSSLQQAGVGVPMFRTTTSGDTICTIDNDNFELSTFIEHIDLSDELHITDDQLMLAGRTLGQIHKVMNTPEFASVLERQDFTTLAEQTLGYVAQFLADFDKLNTSVTDETVKQKLTLLHEIVVQTEKFRAQGIDEFAAFLQEPFIPTHGDFSMLNVLITSRNEAYTIDWDNIKLRPQVWDLQAALSLFSCKYKGNAYVVEPDFHKMQAFLQGYMQILPLTERQKKLLLEVAKYNFAIYWLSYTLPAVLKQDYRLLDLIPEDTEQALYWTKGFETYAEFLNTL